MKHIKFDENYFLTSEQIVSAEEVEVAKKVNHIFVVDVSYSMWNDLPLIKKQLKNRLSNVMNEGDTITIVWFSGDGECGVLKEEVEVKSLKTLTDLNAAIDKWLRPVGVTAFRSPLLEVKQIINRISQNRPDSIYSMIFLTDGWNNDCPWGSVTDALKELENDLAASTFVEYGYYADTQKLTEMASLVGGEKVSTSDFDEFEPIFDNRISAPLMGGKKILVTIENPYLYNFAFTIADNGGVRLHNINENNEVFVSPDTTDVHYFTAIPCGMEDNGKNPGIDRSLYAATYVLSDKLMNEDAEKIVAKLGDVHYYTMLANAFGKQKLNAFKSGISECIADESKRHPGGREKIKPVDDNAYCLMNLIGDISKIEGCLFYPNHESFEYNRIGAKRKAKGSVLSDKDKTRLAEATDVQEAAKILADLVKNNVDAKFVNSNPERGYPVTDLVWNSERANLSLRIKMDGEVQLPENEFKIDSITSFIYRTFTLIKDGIVNVEKLPLNWSQELDDLLVANGVIFSRSTEMDSLIDGTTYTRTIVIDLNSLPLINRGMVKSISAEELGKVEWELHKIKGTKKVYDFYKNELYPKTSKSYADLLGTEAAAWLKTIGVTDYNGFAPKTVAGEANDFYYSVNLATKFKGLSSLPKVDVVLKKIEDKKALKLNEWVMSEALIGYHGQMDNDMFKSLSPEQQDDVLKTYLNKKSADLNIKRRGLLQKIAEIKFALILSKKWFKEFDSFDENKLNLDLDEQNLAIHFDMSEKEVKF